MTLFTFLLVILLFLGTLLSLRAHWRRRNLRQQLASRFPAAHIEAVRILLRDNMITGQPPAKVAAHGYLAVNGSKILLLGRLPGSGVELDETLESEARIAWIPRSASVPGIPDMIRIAHPSQNLFIYGNRPSATRNLFTRLGKIYAIDNLPLPPSTVLNLALIPIAVLMAVSVAATLYFTWEIQPDPGLLQVAQSESGLLAAGTSQKLYLLQDNRVIKETPWLQLAIPGGATAMQFIDDQQLLIGDHRSGNIKTCNLSNMQCQPLPVFASGELSLGGSFKFDLAPDNETLLVSDTAAHRLLQLNLYQDNYYISDQPVCFPNRIRIRSDGHLFVADTNNFRLLEWTDWQYWLTNQPVSHPVAKDISHEAKRCHQAGVGDPFLELPVGIDAGARAFDMLRGGRVWVSDFDFIDDNQLWMLLNSDGMRYGDVALFDESWKPVTRLPLKNDTDPTQILNSDQGLMVIAPNLDTVPLFDTRGEKTGQMGLNVLAQRVKKARQHNANYRQWSSYAMYSLMFSLLLCLLIAHASLRKRVRQIAALR